MTAVVNEGAIMDNGMISSGIFCLRDKVYIDAMPVHNASGLWQAWKMPDGLFMVQPLDRDRIPWGTVYILEAQEVGVMLVPVPNTGEHSDGRKANRANEPDLLAVWYEQARIEQEHRYTTPSEGASRDSDAPQAAPPAPTRPQKEQSSSDEPQLTPLWHPDELFADEDITVSPPKGRPPSRNTAQPAAPRQPSPRGDRHDARLSEDSFSDDDLFSDILPASPPPRSGMRETGSAAKGNKADITEFRDNDEYVEQRAQLLEERMRGEFDSLMRKLDEGDNPDTERELSRLILRGAGFSWKQKYMFSEFGFALRRKKLYKLALTSHMRALGFAPADEHILFNVARAEYELGKVDMAKSYLAKALEVNPAFSAAETFLAFLKGDAKSKG
jgi:tetratricopeptide (TPR) repeat protein